MSRLPIQSYRQHQRRVPRVWWRCGGETGRSRSSGGVMRGGFIRPIVGSVGGSAKASALDWLGAKPMDGYNVGVRNVLGSKPGTKK